MKIEVLGAHNTETDKARLPCLLVDNVIALDAGGLVASLPLERQQGVRAVLLTHHHFDHVKDLVMLGANGAQPPSTVEIYGLRDTLEAVYLYLLDGRMYRDYTQWPSAETPRFRLKPIAPFQHLAIEGHDVLPVPVAHTVPAVGYQVGGAGGRRIFFTGDTGDGLAECWERVSPDVLFIEVTGLNRMEEEMLRLRHLTPRLLALELDAFRSIKKYLPRVIVTHLPLLYEEELRQELAEAGKLLGMELEAGYEGLEIEL
jgi:ribonuclease BN (tRNA processing enzyme)